ncbi:MAG: 50S ribosomal protein L1 [Simkaniaceae bacterium]|nr:50S ribosomal protein L1 [Simkaniaceae bacterium]
MAKKSKRLQDNRKKFDFNKVYSINEAATFLKEFQGAKFDETVDIALKLGVDPKKSDQQVRGTVSLPHGTGKKIVLVALTKGDKAKEALEAGADFAGADELIEKIKGGWTDFNAILATPDMMREVGKLGKILGPRGLMPSPKAGTVTNDVAKAVKEIKAGKVEFKVDKNGVINNAIGKISFETAQIVENFETLISAISRLKPSSAKGQFMQGLSISTTMGPGFKINVNALSAS